MEISPMMSKSSRAGRRPRMEPRCRRWAMAYRLALVVLAMIATADCGANAAWEQLSQARQRSADLLVQFTKAADAANKAVLADTDEASSAFARDAEQAKQAVQSNVDALQPMLQGLNYASETGLLQEFVTRFKEYRELDRRILDLAVENTNLKAQRLSFRQAQEDADAFRDALAAVHASTPAEAWHVKAVAATAVAAVREIQALQAPHIADADDAAMTRIEARMATAEAAARGGLADIGPLGGAASRTTIAPATAALDRFMTVNAEITALSRRNTNVRSAALSLNQKGQVTGACEDSLRALRDALAARGFAGTR
jgi:hypothetical protein